MQDKKRACIHTHTHTHTHTHAEMFLDADRDHNGYLDKKEFSNVLRSAKLNLADK